MESERPIRRRYVVSGTCVQHLSTTVEVFARNEASALIQAESLAYAGEVDWAEGDCDNYDFWVDEDLQTREEENDGEHGE